jgi:hypothetical protein
VLNLTGQVDPSLQPKAPCLYVVACRNVLKRNKWRFESWFQTLALGQPLPTLPIWLDDDLAVPLELEGCYEQTCRALRIP